MQQTVTETVSLTVFSERFIGSTELYWSHEGRSICSQMRNKSVLLSKFIIWGVHLIAKPSSKMGVINQLLCTNE